MRRIKKFHLFTCFQGLSLGCKRNPGTGVNSHVDFFFSYLGPPRGSFNITNSVTRLNSSSFTLKWTRPPYDGGDPNLKYDIEYSKETPDGKYIHWNTRKNIESQEYNVTGLEGGGNYVFRVFVTNIAGRKKEPASKGFSVDRSVSSKGEPCKPGKPLCIHVSFDVIFAY